MIHDLDDLVNEIMSNVLYNTFKGRRYFFSMYVKDTSTKETKSVCHKLSTDSVTTTDSFKDNLRTSVNEFCKEGFINGTAYVFGNAYLFELSLDEYLNNDIAYLKEKYIVRRI